MKISSSCKNCDAGTMLADSPYAVDHDNVSDCTDCLVRTYQPDVGQSQCFPCSKATSPKATTCEGF